MPEEITLDEWRRLQRAGEAPRRPRVPTLELKLPREAPEERDASEARREPYVAAGWTFTQEGRELARYAYHRTQGWCVGPAGRLGDLLGMVDARERSERCTDRP